MCVNANNNQHLLAIIRNDNKSVARQRCPAAGHILKILGMQTGFRSDINGLRAIAVIAVVLFHFNVPGFGGGYVGVDIFFVISGFLMTRIIMPRIADGTFSLTDFYTARLRRILPALVFLCLTLMIFGWLFLLPTEYNQLGKHIVATLGFFSNILFASESGYFDSASREKLLLHTWSLSVEWQFYMLYPLAILVLRNLRGIKGLPTALLLVLAASLLLSLYLGTAGFYSLPARIWELLAGSVVAVFPIRMEKRLVSASQYVGLALIGFSVFYFSEQDAWPSWRTVIPTIGAALLIASADTGSLIARNRALQLTGRISYSVYLWHWPIAASLAIWGYSGDVLWSSVGVLASLVSGLLSYFLVEQRFGKPNKEFQNIPLKTFSIPLAIRLMVIPAFAAGMGLFIWSMNGFPSKSGRAVRIADQEAKNKSPYRSCFLTRGLTSPGCVVGGDRKKVRLVVIGDSHSEAVLGAVAAAADGKAGGGALYLGYSACMTIPGAKYRHSRATSPCGDYVENVFNLLKRDFPGIPILIVNRTSAYVFGENRVGEKWKQPSIYFGDAPSAKPDAAYLADFKSHYVNAVCRLASDHPVYITMPIPEIGINVPQTLGRQLMTHSEVPDVSVSRRDYAKRHEFVIETMETTRQACGAHLLDPLPYLCPPGVLKGACLGSFHGRPLYYDDNHLSEYGNRFLVPMFAKIFDSADKNGQARIAITEISSPR